MDVPAELYRISQASNAVERMVMTTSRGAVSVKRYRSTRVPSSNTQSPVDSDPLTVLPTV